MGLSRFIDLSPSSFTLPSHMPHPTPAHRRLRRRRTFLSSRDAVGENPKRHPGKARRERTLLSIKRSSTWQGGHAGRRRRRAQRAPLVKIISRSGSVAPQSPRTAVVPEPFSPEGLAEEVLECSFDIADEKQCRLIARKTPC